MTKLSQLFQHSARNDFGRPTAQASAQPMRDHGLTLIAVVAAIFCFTAPAYAGIAPNPGGAVVVTNSTTSSYVDVNTQVTQRVDNYSTTLLAFLNGSQVYSGTFLVQFSDPSVQAAVTAADSILSGDGASFGPPSLFSSSSLLQGSVTDPPVLTCSPCNQSTGNVTNSTTQTFGPATILVGDNQSDTFTVLAGQLDININTNNEYYAYYNVDTTNTFLDSQTYEILGTTQTVTAPEPASASILFAGFGAIVAARRRRSKTK